MTDESSSNSRIEQLFQQHASDRDDAPAVSSGEASLSYRSLAEHSMQVAELVAAAARHRGSPVGVLLPNSPAMPEAVLGVWQSGNVVVPVSTSYSKEAVQKVVSTLGINIIVTSHRIIDRFAGLTSVRVLHDDGGWSSSADRFIADRHSIATNSDHAVVFLTSGTTGQPKIVALTHGNILFNLGSLNKAIPRGEADKSFVCVPLCHSYGFTLQMLGTLCSGAELYIGQGHMISSELVKELAASRCTSFFGVPTAYRMLLDGSRRLGNGEQLRSLRILVNGASPMTPEVLSGVRESLPWADVHLTYGLSEASPLVTSLPARWVDEKPCSIGRAVDGVKLVLQCEDGTITTQAGCVGEILIKGPSVIESYLGNYKVTAESFVEGYLRTGDVAMIDADGCLCFKGRIKDLINRGGEKIYPEDVEVVLQSHEAVMQSAVVPCPHATLGEVSFAFVVLKEGMQSAPAELRSWCARFLSVQQIPVEIEIVDSLPRTVTGKIRKNELVLNLANRRAKVSQANP